MADDRYTLHAQARNFLHSLSFPSAAGKYLTQKAVWLFEKVGLVPSGTHNVGEALKTAGGSQTYIILLATLSQHLHIADSLVAGGREKLFTPMQLFVW